MVSAHRKIRASLTASAGTVKVPRRTLTQIALGGAAFLLIALTPATVTAAPTSVTCSPTKMKISVSTLEDSKTSSQTFKTVPEATVSFTQGGASASCVVVRFSASTYSESDFVYVRAYLDNATAALPAEMQYSGFDGNNASKTQSYEFVFPNVTPGSHVLRMQFRSLTGGLVAVHLHTTVVVHAP